MDFKRYNSKIFIKIAVRALKEGKYGKAEEHLIEAERLFPSQRAKDLLAKLRTVLTPNGQPPIIQPSKQEPKSAELEYTSDQLEAVENIKKCKGYYEVLGIRKEATMFEIKKAYKKFALRIHPDKNKAPGAAEAFKSIGYAVAVLTDPDKRKSYDLCSNQDSVHRTGGGRNYTSEYAYDYDNRERGK